MKHLAVLLSLVALSTAAHAQASPSSMPESHRPPAGMCRIWIDGVPPAHQPAPTDCATAIRKRPMNARVVFGSNAPERSARTVAPPPAVQSNFVAPSASSRDEQARNAQLQREEQDRQRIEAQRAEAQRQHDEQARRAPPPTPAPPASQRSQERSAPPPRPRVEKAPRPPHESYTAHRPR